MQCAIALKNQGLEDLKIVAAELIQFLLLNTQYDSVETIAQEQKSLKESLKELVSNKKRLKASLNTANNKISDMAKTLSKLEKKIDKL